MTEVIEHETTRPSRAVRAHGRRAHHDRELHEPKLAVVVELLERDELLREVRLKGDDASARLLRALLGCDLCRLRGQRNLLCALRLQVESAHLPLERDAPRVHSHHSLRRLGKVGRDVRL